MPSLSTRFAEDLYTVRMINRVQVKMARAALGWGVRDLASKAGVSANTVSRYENGADALGETLTRIQRALEDAGIVVIDADEQGPGVRLRDPNDSRI
jgi:transcriptional regulator with XRE-family HTH domain